MVYFGLQHMAWAKAISYGDGLANNEFWRAELYWYSLLGKVQFQLICLVKSDLARFSRRLQDS